MISFFYDLCLFLAGVCLLPKVLSKHHRIPKIHLKSQVFWIHAVSVGEMRAASPLFFSLKHRYPDASFLVSCITKTGYQEAKRSMPGADLHFFLPWDISWVIKPLVKRLHPSMLILVEGDFWYQLMRAVKAQGGAVSVVNGKMSVRSARRFGKVSFFSRALFSLVDIFCVQSDRFAQRFADLGIDPKKIHVTGNLKLDIKPAALSTEEISTWRKKLGIEDKDFVLVVGSTHEPEEELLIQALMPIKNVKILLVPRHPERFASVAAIVQKMQNPGDHKVVLMDAMGILNTCYQLADIAVVGGSFASHLRGHNIFEPLVWGTPVLFGPYMEAQLDLVELVLSSHAGSPVSLDTLASTISSWLDTPSVLSQMRHNALACAASSRGSTAKTLATLDPYLKLT